VVQATLKGLSGIRSPGQIAAKRGKTIEEITG
jgi:small subunit ribosomal protein S5